MRQEDIIYRLSNQGQKLSFLRDKPTKLFSSYITSIDKFQDLWPLAKTPPRLSQVTSLIKSSSTNSMLVKIYATLHIFTSPQISSSCFRTDVFSLHCKNLSWHMWDKYGVFFSFLLHLDNSFLPNNLTWKMVPSLLVLGLL